MLSGWNDFVTCQCQMSNESCQKRKLQGFSLVLVEVFTQVMEGGQVLNDWNARMVLRQIKR